MGKIYSTPEDITPPDFKIWFDEGREAYEKLEQEYVEKVRAFVKKRKPRAKYVGEIVRWPVADGCAEYMIMSLRPVELIHLELGDAWHFQMAHRATAEDLKEMVDIERKRSQFLAKRSEFVAQQKEET